MIFTGVQHAPRMPRIRARAWGLLLIGKIPSAVAPVVGAGTARGGIDPSPVRGSAP